MSVDGVSTYTLFQTTLKDVNRVEGELAKAQIQLSSGNSSQDFAGIAGQAQQYLSLDSSIARTAQYLNDNQIVETRVSATSSALDQVITAATSLQTLIAQRRTGTSNNAAFDTQLRGIWQTVTQALNSSVSGQFLFSGSRVNTPAVDDKNFPALTDKGELDTRYYQGNTQDLTVRPQDNTVLQYNVRADDAGIQKIFAALAFAQKGDQESSDSELAKATNTLQEGLQGVISTQATVNATKVTLTTIDQNHQSLKLYWQGVKDNIGNTDVVAVSTQVAINQGILQAAFQAFAKINSLRLSDYLK